MAREFEDIYELTPLQQGILFHSRYAPESFVYHVQLDFTLEGEFDVAAFERAWKAVAGRHPPLRTSCVWEDLEHPYQVVHSEGRCPIARHDWSGMPAMERAARVEALVAEDRARPFDLTEAPLMRLTLVRLGEREHRFLWTFHHIALEGWSASTVLGDVRRLYDAIRKSGKAALPPARPFGDFIRWLQKQDLAAAEAYWRKRLGDVSEPTHLPIDRAAGDVPARVTRFDDLHLTFSEDTTAALQRLARDARVTLNTLIHGAWSILLSRYTGQQSVVFGVVGSGRPADLPGSESMVGLFVNTLPSRVDVRREERLIPWLQQLQRQQAEMREYEFSSLAQVQAWSELPRGRPLFDSVLAFENWLGELPREQWLEGLAIREFRCNEGSDQPLTLISVPARRLDLVLRYDLERFDAAAITRMRGHLEHVLHEMLADPERPITELGLLTEGERRQVVGEWSGTVSEYPREARVHELFEAQVDRAPDRVAVSFEGRTLSYGELDARANRVANYLRRLGVGSEDRVGLCVERSLDLVVGILGILKAGAAYLPLDPEYPEARLAFMLDDAGAPVLLTQSGLRSKLPEHDARVVCLDTEWGAIGEESESRPGVEGRATDLAYVIYTSGSTGMPKGTAIPHRAVVRLVADTDFVELGAEEVFLQFAAISFDASTFELWGSLLHGARLVIFPARIPSLEELGEVIRTEGITTLWLTAALFHQMVDEQLESLGGVRQLLAGGDALSVPHVKRYLATLDGDRRLINGYGPTENTTFTCCYVMGRDTEIEGTVPIGRPICNTSVYLLDGQGHPVPVGVPGELCTGGDGLAREYWNEPELTAEKFVPDRFSSTPGGRLYRTGDRARYRPDGVIEFLGRVDHQVKIRGFRVELGEIEAALRAHAGVGDAVVMTREDAPGDRRLVAWVATGEGAAPSPSELRGFVRERLPEYMVPAVFVMLERLPLNANGKVDRGALPASEGERQTDQAYVAPRSELEQQIAAVWREVLRVDEVGIDDNFFDLGGNSLLLMRAHGQLSHLLPREVSIVELFRLPSIRTLAARCHQNDRDPRERSSREKIRERASRQRNALARRKQRQEEKRAHE